MKIFILSLICLANLYCGILGPLENIIPNEKYSERDQQNYHYTYDSSRGRYRAIEDCEYYRRGSNKDEFCEQVVSQRVYPVQTYQTNPNAEQDYRRNRDR